MRSLQFYPTLLFGLFFLPFLKDDEQIFQEKTRLASPDSSFSQNIVTVGRSFLDVPYQSHTLETEPTEQLIVNLRAFDCLTFVETVAAICLPRPLYLPDFQSFKENLTSLRYRDGIVDGYGSRLHYFTEWLLQQENAGRLRLISEELGGAILQKKINFMSRKRLFYAGLADSMAFEKVQAAEARLSEQPLFFIPKNKVREAENSIHDGDIITFTAARDGLDVTHEGFAVRQNGRVFLLHASSEFGRVMLSKWPLAEYLLRNKGQTGIIVARWNG